MKFYLFVCLFIGAAILAKAQPCKVLKKGMSEEEVTRLCGNPKQKTFGLKSLPADRFSKKDNQETVHETTDSKWHYGSQVVTFIYQKVDTITINLDSDSLLLEYQVKQGMMTLAESKEQFEQIKKENCR